jgi:sporulation protein YlmC with PRC-barrel domain
MNKLQLALLSATVACSSLALGQTAQQQPSPATSPSTAPSTSQTEGTAADTTPPGATPTTPQQVPDSSNPAPATSPTEGTAADSTPPGSTQQSSPQPGSTSTTPSPSQDSSASSTSSSGSDSTRLSAAGASGGHSASQIIGATVQGTQGDTVGTVEDVLIDANGAVSAVVITPSGNSTTAQHSTVPWSAIKSVGADGKIVVDSSRVQQGSTSR